MKNTKFYKHSILTGMGYVLGSGFAVNHMQNRTKILDDESAMYSVKEAVEKDMFDVLNGNYYDKE